MKNFDNSLKIGAKKFHQQRLFAEKLSQQYRKKFFLGNKIKSSLLERRKCPVCNIKNDDILFIKGGGTHKKCKKCEMIYLDPVFKDKSLEKFYKFNSDHQSLVSLNEKKFYYRMFLDGIKFIQKSKKIKTLLDIGCSNGLSLDVSKRLKIKTYGLEINKKEAEIASKKHIIFNESIFTFKEKMRFDTITMWDVIEHIKDVHRLLKKISSLLNKNGIFFFQTPKSNSLANSILHEKSNCFDGIEHVNLYSLKSLNIIAKKYNFKIISIRTVFSEIPIIDNYLNYENPYLGPSKTKKIFGFMNEKKLHNLLLGYKFQVLFKKL
ncbi:class I SAM-dependent methyltransferase [Candidatus Pelagibacter sp.]|nr:class I SAM-dependent methyltransferase [Candidatus Pelagibacter sp.]